MDKLLLILKLIFHNSQANACELYDRHILEIDTEAGGKLSKKIHHTNS